MEPLKEYDLLIVTDATNSMSRYLRALSSSLPQIIAVSALTDAFANIGVLAYWDYSRGEVTDWSGWHGRNGTVTRDELVDFTRNLKTDTGGDRPEATKTALAQAHSVMRSEAKTLLLLYTDAPPHLRWNDNHPNMAKEQEFLLKTGFDKSSPQFADWVSAVRTIAKRGAQVFVVLKDRPNLDAEGSYVILSRETDGAIFKTYSDSSNISRLTMSIIMTWLGVSKPGATPLLDLAAAMSNRDVELTGSVQNEKSLEAKEYFRRASLIIQSGAVDETQLRGAIVPISTPVQDFSKRHATDEKYRELVVELLAKIIDKDPSAIALNPVFGGLWRAVCNDRTNKARDSLIQQFGSSVNAIAREDEKRRMKEWLSESYDYKADIVATIEEVVDADRYPCVFLDPTQNWSTPAGTEAGKDGSTSHSPNSFTRDELLEIGRSCDYKVLRRLGDVLTRLTYVASKEELPTHVQDVPTDQVPRVPVALAQPKYQRTFWKILLHVILPGTKLAERPAALLAALSIRMGIKPLLAAADSEMLHYSKSWNTLDIPETWNTNCLTLILDADKDFEARRRAGNVAADIPAEASFLSDGDRRLFTRLVDFSMLKANMKTTLQATVSWRPDRAKFPIGPLVTCHGCRFPRSVTVMGARSTCGICVPSEADYLAHGLDRVAAIQTNVSKDQTEADEATWVECSVTSCRAQYVVYQVASMGLRPKCYYCRAKPKLLSSLGEQPHDAEKAPTVECRKCLSRMIWPEQYRPAHFSEGEFRCPACVSGRKTTVDVETTARNLAAENGTAWLLRNTTKIADLLSAPRSLYKTVIALDSPADFVAGVEILPSVIDTTTTTTATATAISPSTTTTTPYTDTDKDTDNTAVANPPLHLTLGGKRIRNTNALRASLWHWIAARRAEAGICSLCFGRFSKRGGPLRSSDSSQRLRRACGRSGCAQVICDGCRRRWYGRNARGRVIHVAALSCPFCRRVPAPSMLPESVKELRYLGNLRAAVQNGGGGGGGWIYAWCADCGVAKPFAERVCAPPGQVPEGGDGGGGWCCEECREKGAGGDGRKAVRKCPGCGAPTEKAGGCDHIECSVCGTDWCFFCGEAVDPAEIYVHMVREHGGLYGGRPYEDGEGSGDDEVDGIDNDNGV
ncbi:hypothetical protein SLS62_003521 [Diatrype stigma]|uniref:RING-type domain-containing protein n=1 Tax=Diatrype stigma TaxID=117547 RepID=A0AAN9UVZ8_9PEZI